MPLHELLKIERPIVFLDVETTGVSVERDRIVEFAAVRLLPDGSRRQWSQLFNPGIPIPPDTSEVHGITDADVKDMPPFSQFAQKIFTALQDCDLAGYNMRFDCAVLKAEFARCNIAWKPPARIIDAFSIFRKKHPRALSMAVARYCGPERAEQHALMAHRALGDVEATIDVLTGQLLEHQDLPRDIEELSKFCSDRHPNAIDEEGKLIMRNGRICVWFGKYKGQALEDMDDGFLGWMLGNDFPEDTKKIVRDIHNARRKPKETSDAEPPHPADQAGPEAGARGAEEDPQAAPGPEHHPQPPPGHRGLPE